MLTTIPNWRLPRLNRRIDQVVLLPSAIAACTIRQGRRHAARDRTVAEDAALDLYDFHAGSQAYPVVPVLVTMDAARSSPVRPLMLPGVTPVVETNAAGLDATLRELAASPGPPLDPQAWQAAAYRPIPSLIEAARMLYARHGVAEIASAHAEAANLRDTRRAIAAAVARAAADRRPTIVFVTGIPGAGKTLCGLDTAFAGQAAFLTGNPSLVHVLREALARDAGTSLRATRQRMESVIQALPAFRDCYAASGIPAERVVVIDEAQRCWSAAHTIAKTAQRRAPLHDSEPAVLLDIMARRTDGPVIVCLIGQGQEIHDGEGGIAEWHAALADRPAWHVLGPEQDGAFQLRIPVRSLRCAATPAWVDAVLRGDAAGARALARDLPFTLVRDLPDLRALLRAACRGSRRAGLLCSSGARRLRAEGLGATLPHDDPGAVARWFLDPAPDIRGSNALEVAATEFFAQGLELDAAGLCWDLDLVRNAGSWQARAFRGSAWTHPRSPAKQRQKLNAYRVLLTRARYETVIWVPRGDPADATRAPADYDRVADFLRECGVEAQDMAPPDRGSPSPAPLGDWLPFMGGAGPRGGSQDRHLEFGMADAAASG